MEKIINAGDVYYWLVPRNFSVDVFLDEVDKIVGMRKGSFASFYVRKIFSALIVNAENLTNEYKIWYCEEYQSFKDFLYDKKMIDADIIEKFNLNSDIQVLLLNIKLFSYNVDQLMEEWFDKINEIIEKVDL